MADSLPEHGVPAAVERAVGDWSLTVDGAVASPTDVTCADLRELPWRAFTEDFDCVEGWTAEAVDWRGVEVGAILDRATPAADASHALVHAHDGDYACAFSLDALRQAVLALEMDGEALPVAHGGPARLVPTGESDCWESVKWVARIDVTREPPAAKDTAKRLALSRIE